MTILLWLCGVLAYVMASIGAGVVALRRGHPVSEAAWAAVCWPLIVAICVPLAAIVFVLYSCGWAMETLARRPEGPPVAGYREYLQAGFR